MKLPFQEPTTARYIYINPKTNMVHLLMPIMSGTEIGLDNTCKSVYSLQEFFGLLGANKQSAALGILTDYKAALEFDLKYMPASEEKTLKAARLTQINNYLKILKEVQQDTRITEPLKQTFPLYPEPLTNLMDTSEANLHSIILRPFLQDNYLRTTDITPTFSANHNKMDERGNVIPEESILANKLHECYQNISFKPKSKEGLIESFLDNHRDLAVDFNEIKKALIEEIKNYLGVIVDFENTQGNRYAPSLPMTVEYMNQEYNPDTIEEYINAFIQYCTPNLFDAVEGSPFYAANETEQLSILTQFFLAELNIICREQGLTLVNFGQILENDAKLSLDLAKAVKDALGRSDSVEDTLIQYINQHEDIFDLKHLIPEKDITSLKERFKAHWEQIKESPHFDEFMLLGDKKGLFVAHQGFIATNFASFLQTGWQYDLDKFIQDFATINKPNNIIPHKNEHINEANQGIEIDLATIDNDALQDLYEDINTYPDKSIKEELLKQFKQARPDFKPKIDAKQFLQHVAYGEQNEAEKLLQQNPELAQALLTSDNIPFTDYSGRTFKCTAYEYAYWALDTHMQRMLEKYIRQDEETRLLILKRVKEMEKLVPSSKPAWFFGLFKHPPEPQGLHYTTEDKQGQIIEHQDISVDLTPLIRALEHYIDEYNNRPNKTEDDLEVLEEIWIKEVGGAQRNVTAHIAHEYNHPDRSFDDVNKNPDLLDASNPDNLKRSLKFYNFDTRTYDNWFSPNSYSLDSGVGSFAILRGSERDGAGRVAGCVAWPSAGQIDLAALKTIVQVRTNDKNESLLNLSRPLNPHASLS